MRITLQLLAFLALAGGCFWIIHSPREIEPYVTTVVLLGGFIGTFAGSKKEDSVLKDTPDVVVYIVEVGKLQHRLVLENRGTSSAFDVDVNIHLKQGQECPLMSGDTELPIREIFANDERQILVGLTLGSGTKFDATWSWKDANGREFVRKNIIDLRK